jgi:hypothetical protein
MTNKYSAVDAERIIQAEKDIQQQSLKPQGLRIVKHSFTGLKANPDDFSQESPAGVVFYNLQICYQNGGNVSEGSVGDVIWGFRQSGIPGNIVMDGFTELYRLGYLDFTDPNGIQLLGSFNEKAWYKWSPKYFGLLQDANQKSDVLISDSIKPEDTTVEKLED